MLRLLRLVSWRHVKRHRLRTLLTFLGVVLGVAVIVAIALVNRTLTGSFQRTIDLIAGKAVLQVENGESGFPAEPLPTGRDTAGGGRRPPGGRRISAARRRKRREALYLRRRFPRGFVDPRAKVRRRRIGDGRRPRFHRQLGFRSPY